MHRNWVRVKSTIGAMEKTWAEIAKADDNCGHVRVSCSPLGVVSYALTSIATVGEVAPNTLELR